MYKVVEERQVLLQDDGLGWIASQQPVTALYKEQCNVLMDGAISFVVWTGQGVPVEQCWQIQRPGFKPVWIRNKQESEKPDFVHNPNGGWTPVHADDLAIVPERYAHIDSCAG